MPGGNHQRCIRPPQQSGPHDAVEFRNQRGGIGQPATHRHHRGANNVQHHGQRIANRIAPSRDRFARRRIASLPIRDDCLARCLCAM